MVDTALTPARLHEMCTGSLPLMIGWVQALTLIGREVVRPLKEYFTLSIYITKATTGHSDIYHALYNEQHGIA